ncbi:MAG: class I SAM-dependent methyltransferase [Clostridiaceae bacterium]|nr:class I SAM-dependent methyltransferase [Clostridiaceae bacterium]
MDSGEQWKTIWAEEERKSFEGWDFSYIDGRYRSGALPWDYQEIVMSHLRPHHRLLDLGTGGGEALLSFGHPFEKTSVTESYPPNIALCRERLEPLGITVEGTPDDSHLPFEDASFDVITNRHESFVASEIKRLLVPGGLFITQQVGGRNNEDLSPLVIPDYRPQCPEHTLFANTESLKREGFEILLAGEAFPKIRFDDIGALVYFAKIIEWEFPGFSVEKHFDALCGLQRRLEKDGFIEGTEHRFLIGARKPE